MPATGRGAFITTLIQPEIHNMEGIGVDTRTSSAKKPQTGRIDQYLQQLIADRFAGVRCKFKEFKV